ncbi:LCP family protein [Cellulomonas biazotea]|uniref:LCP family protein n=2 Tax=Cellulomonas biazotea TaxID=1709 RepID=UPI0035EC60E4
MPVSGRGGTSTGTAGAPARPASRPSAPRTASSRPPSVTPGGARTPTGAAGGSRTPAGPGGSRTPVGPGGPSTPPRGGTVPGAPSRRRRRLVVAVAALVVVALLAWPIGLVMWANGKVQHTTALSGAAGTEGTTYLLTGSDSRADGGIAADGTEGARTDTILLLHVPASGPSALISLPRDTYVEIPDHGASKLNAAFSWGQAPLLVRTVEQLTGLTVDHYAEIGMAGVGQVVDAVGGVNLCHDADVNDADSGMVWTAGCHDVDGTQALSFARMRKADLKGDVGRAERQRQLVSAVMAKVSPSSLVLNPGKQVALVDAGTGALTLDEDSNIVDLARLALAFRDATGPEGITGTPPIIDLDYRPGDVGSTVRLDPDQTPVFFAAIRDGSLPPGAVGGVPTP